MFRIVIVAIGLGCALQAQAGDPTCLAYEPATVELTGTLERRTYPGPPNYESVERGDEPETGLYLVLPLSVCIKADPSDEALAYEQNGVRLMQLNLTADDYKSLVPLVGTAITVKGTLYAAHSGHHHARVILLYQSSHIAAQ